MGFRGWLLCLILLPAAVHAQAVLRGVVNDTSGRHPLEGVEVVLEGSARRTATNASGQFLLDSLPPGSQYFVIRSIGYGPVRFKVKLKKADTVRVEARLVPEGVRLDPVVVVAAPKGPKGYGVEGFEERRRLGLGKFIDSTELRRAEQLRIADVLARNANIDLREIHSPPTLRAYSRRFINPGDPNARCYMLLFVDGMFIPDGNLSPFDPAHLRPWRCTGVWRKCHRSLVVAVPSVAW
jgi:hypothetical protein